MNTKRQSMHEATALNPVTEFPVRQIADRKPNGDGERLGWWTRLQLLYGVRANDMANHPQTPNGIPLNISTIGTWVVIIVAILGGFWWSYQLGQTNGKQQQTIEQLTERLTKAESDAAEAKKFSIYAAAGQDEENGHKPNQPKKEK